MRRATVRQWASRNSRDELAHNEVRIIFSTYFISNLSYYISNIYFELILGLYLVVYIYPIYTCYIFDLIYFEFIVLYIEYIFRTYFRAVFGRIYISNLYVLYFRLILFRIYRTIYRIYISNLF